jgi:hypothetical protein
MNPQLDVQVRVCGDMGLLAYNRITQRGANVTVAQETRVWEKKDGKWIHVHFHKSI